MPPPRKRPDRFVLLDRDGTLVLEKHYLKDPQALELYPEALAALRRFQDLGLGILILSNQSGLARGLFRREDLEAIHHQLRLLLAKEGLYLDGIYVCPHAPEDDCRCRKPKPGLVWQAVEDHGFDPSRSFVIGDKASDIELGKAIGAITILVETGYGKETLRKGGTAPHYVALDLLDAARFVEGKLRVEDALDPSLRSKVWKETRCQASLAKIQTHFLAGALLRERAAYHLLPPILEAVALMAEAVQAGNKILLCGNGGSAADCQHMAAELVGRLDRNRLRAPIPALALTTDSSILTAVANDCGFPEVFERQIEALGKKGDVLLAISTSGSSPNILRAVQKAKALSLTVIALTSQEAPLASQADVAIAVPGTDTQLVQELHLAVEHLLCLLLEEELARPS
jgi:D-glycero-D-manno-heptose 1,7-bisphosphate phosphatase